jgi:hypothetical protein
MTFKKLKPIELPKPPQAIVPEGVALWRLYISGRWGPEKHLGFVIADARSMQWVKNFPALAMDIVRRSG